MPRNAAKIGAHVSVSGGLVRGTLATADRLGAEVVQIFVANPRGWANPGVDPAADEAFRENCATRALPVYVHAPYLINFGSPSPDTLRKSGEALAFSLQRGAAIGAAGVVMHAGSALQGNPAELALAQVREHVLPLLEADRPRLLIEPTAGGGGALAHDIESISTYLAALDDERIGLCIDTCHLHAAGHDLSSAERMRSTFTGLVRAVGRNRIGLLHVNDSRDAPGSKRDRHACIGAGTIGEAGFAALFKTAAIRGVPMVVETEDSSHAADIAALKQLRSGPG